MGHPLSHSQAQTVPSYPHGLTIFPLSKVTGSAFRTVNNRGTSVVQNCTRSSLLPLSPPALSPHLSLSLVVLFCPDQEVEEAGQTVTGAEGAAGVTDVIQQLLELSEQVTGESAQAPTPVPAISMETGINQDILQVGHPTLPPQRAPLLARRCHLSPKNK